MQCRFVVKVTDVFYFPVKGAKVLVRTAPTAGGPTSGDQFKDTPAKSDGVHPTEVLDIAEFEVVVTHPDFMGAHQSGQVQPGDKGGLPKAIFGNRNQLFEQELPSYDLTVHTHDGAVPVVELYIALMRLVNTTEDVKNLGAVFARTPSLNKSVGLLGPSNHQMRIFSKDALLASDVSKGPFAFDFKIPGMVGKSHFAFWKPTPDTRSDSAAGRELIAIHDPSTKFTNRKTRTGIAQEAPIHYHVFMHPSTSWFPDPRYPLGSWWLDLVSRYVFSPQVSGGSKAMANQTVAAGLGNTILIFPVGSGTRWHNDLLTQDGVMRLVHEVNYFVQRRDGVRYPLQPVGTVGISAYSSSISFVKAILGTPPPRFSSGAAIREVIDLDGRVMVNNRVSPSGMNDLGALFRRWVREDLPNRAVRSYSQLRNVFDALQNADPGAKVTSANRCSLVHGPSVTALFAPLAAWDFFFITPVDATKPISPANLPILNQNAFAGHGPDMVVHDIIPAWFLQHGLSLARHD